MQDSTTAPTPTTAGSPWVAAAAAVVTPLWSAAVESVALCRGLTLAALSAAGGAVAGGGIALLLFLLLTAMLAPPSDTFSRPLLLDFSQADLLGQASFLALKGPADGLPLASPALQNARHAATSIDITTARPRAAEGPAASPQLARPTPSYATRCCSLPALPCPALPPPPPCPAGFCRPCSASTSGWSWLCPRPRGRAWPRW